MKTTLKLALASLVLLASSNSAFAFGENSGMFGDNNGFKMGSVDDSLNGITRLLAQESCGFINVKAGASYILFSLSNDDFLIRQANVDTTKFDIGLPSEIVLGQNNDGSVGTVGRRVGIVDPQTQEVCVFVRQPSK